MTCHADLGQQEVSLVAVALLGTQSNRCEPGSTFVLPLTEPAGHAEHVGVTEFLKGLCGECAANTAGAVHHHRHRLVDDSGFHLRFKVSARNVDHVRQCTLLELIGLANIEYHHAARGNLVGGSGSVYFGDVRLGGSKEVTKRRHDGNATCEVGFSAWPLPSRTPPGASPAIRAAPRTSGATRC